MTHTRTLRRAALTALSLASITAATAAPKPMDGDIAHTLIGKLRSTKMTPVELSDKGAAANVARDFGNNQGFQPSFRWAGNVTYRGTFLQMCAAPRQLDFSGNYSCWNVDAMPLLMSK